MDARPSALLSLGAGFDIMPDRQQKRIEKRNAILQSMQAGKSYNEAGALIGICGKQAASIVGSFFDPLRKDASCSECGTRDRIVFHHESYWPEIVVPLCISHHQKRHSKEAGDRNRKRKVFFTHNGETKSLKEWSAITGISESVLGYRHRKGWPDEKIFMDPRWAGCKKVVVNGVEKYMAQACRDAGQPVDRVYDRLQKGMSLEAALTTPPMDHLSNAVKITIKGISKTIREWADAYNLPFSTVYSRWKLMGQEGEDLLKPKQPRRNGCSKLTFNGFTGYRKEIAKHFGVSIHTVLTRTYKYGITFEESMQRSLDLKSKRSSSAARDARGLADS